MHEKSPYPEVYGTEGRRSKASSIPWKPTEYQNIHVYKNHTSKATNESSIVHWGKYITMHQIILSFVKRHFRNCSVSLHERFPYRFCIVTQLKIVDQDYEPAICSAQFSVEQKACKFKTNFIKCSTTNVYKIIARHASSASEEDRTHCSCSFHQKVNRMKIWESYFKQSVDRFNRFLTKKRFSSFWR